MRREQLVWEGRDLLESADRDVLDSTVLASLEEGVVHLTYSHNQPCQFSSPLLVVNSAAYQSKEYAS